MILKFLFSYLSNKKEINWMPEKQITWNENNKWPIQGLIFFFVRGGLEWIEQEIIITVSNDFSLLSLCFIILLVKSIV